jgi:hypothetical protein
MDKPSEFSSIFPSVEDGNFLSLSWTLKRGEELFPEDPTKPFTDPQPWMVQEERSPQALSLAVARTSFHRVSGQSSGHPHFPTSVEESEQCCVHPSVWLCDSHCFFPRHPLRSKAQRQPHSQHNSKIFCKSSPSIVLSKGYGSTLHNFPINDSIPLLGPLTILT